MRVLATDCVKEIGKKVNVRGWVNGRRDHGGVVFIDLRDHTGIIQLVFNPEFPDFKQASSLRDEFVISVEGIVKERSKGLENPNIETGKIEILVEELEILNKSQTPPIATRDAEDLSNEELRLKYRYLDLRRLSMQEMLKRRARFTRFIQDFMDSEGFIEIATPILANSSPEGARDFLVPSRVHQGKFYALPQAPQQFKQLLMVGGVPRYYQIAPCFRDEDPRADRLYGDFYQLDMEMSFVDGGDDVRKVMDKLMIKLVTEFAQKKLLTPEIKRFTFAEVMEKYGSDKPDLRYGMELVELTDILKTSEFSVFKEAECVKAICVKDAASLSRSQIDNFTEIAKSNGAGGLAYFNYADGEIKSPITKFLDKKSLDGITKATGAVDGDAVFFGAGKRVTVNKVLGVLRDEFANHFNLKNPDEIAMCWVIDFPFYEWDENKKKLEFGHNPFSMPKGGEKALDVEDKLSIMADQYDLVMNGYEVSSGAVRNHSPEIMYKAFGILGYDKKYVEQRFGGMLNAFKYGAPPHAGNAPGLDRIFMILTGIENIRDIVAFPKNGKGVDLMMNSPSVVDDEQLKELGL